MEKKTLKEYWPLLAVVIAVILADVILFITGQGLFTVSKAIQMYGIRQLLSRYHCSACYRKETK